MVQVPPLAATQGLLPWRAVTGPPLLALKDWLETSEGQAWLLEDADAESAGETRGGDPSLDAGTPGTREVVENEAVEGETQADHAAECEDSGN